jgi:hypothetical protein
MSRLIGGTGTLWSKLGVLRAPLVVVLYSSDGAVDDLTAEIAFDTPGDDLLLTSLPVDLAEEPNRPLIVRLPLRDEDAAVQRLSLERDRLSTRAAPLVLLLQTEGAGMRALKKLPFLISFAQGRIVNLDALAVADPVEERRTFQEATGLTPEDFLLQRSNGQLPDDLDANLWAHRARTLVESSQ